MEQPVILLLTSAFGPKRTRQPSAFVSAFGGKDGVIGRQLVDRLKILGDALQLMVKQIGILHRRLLVIVRDDDVCRRRMTVPGVGPVVALTFRVTVDVPGRFRNSKAVGAVFGSGKMHFAK
jgi:transposase